MSKYYPGTAVFNGALEDAADAADKEADKLEADAAAIGRQIAIAPRRGLKWRMEEFLAGARAARRIAWSIRMMKRKG